MSDAHKLDGLSLCEWVFALGRKLTLHSVKYLLVCVHACVCFLLPTKPPRPTSKQKLNGVQGKVLLLGEFTL